MKEMTIVEAMKTLKRLEKRMVKNPTLITKYSSQPDNEKPFFADKESQSDEIKQLIQSTEDLAKEYQTIHQSLTYTNLMVKVELDGKNYSIHELILIRRKLNDLRTRSLTPGSSQGN